MPDLPPVPAEREASDELLMTRVQRGDRTAFEVLYARWRQPVYSFLIRARLDQAAADDALQETFARVFSQAHRYDPARPFRPWLYTLAFRFGVDQRRVLRFFSWTRPSDDANDVAVNLPAQGADSGPTRLAVAQVLARLPQRQRSALALAADGLTGAEIGEILGLSEGSARNLLNESRNAFRQIWQPSEVNHDTA